ncbi:universal stress protein [Halocatena marina]|uniref:Universal stress protein n=1 Tax=Halocatena marina TaxID=2934937 RepID=A0ABD5YR58_9EURY|nr:universal stress protein [Halocatena marina]
MKLLVGVDRSDRALAVLEAADERAKATENDLTVAVVEYEDGPPIDRLEQDVRGCLSELSSDAKVRSLTGHAGSQLVDFAERKNFDQIIIDGGKTSPLGKIQLNDVAEFVLLNAPMTVTLVR